MLLLNENPWMGLASYDVADSHLFFGRETEILNLEIAIKKNLSTVIYGESGAGKTSLIRAGLFPNLTDFWEILKTDILSVLPLHRRRFQLVRLPTTIVVD